MASNRNPQIDAYIAKSAAFAQPVLQHIRSLVHQVCPAALETVKWGMPHFEYKGILCHMAAFKHYCSVGFYKAELMKDAAELAAARKESMGHLGKITSMADLPSDEVLKGYIQQAAALNEAGVKKEVIKKDGNKDLLIPQEITAALANDAVANHTFNNFSYSHKKEYIEWITEAKTATTRIKRVTAMLGWLADGKTRNWKYEKK